MQTTTTVSTPPTRDASPSTEWSLDPSHSHAGFKVRHLMISNVRGEFGELGGTVRGDLSRPETVEIDVEIAVGSIVTRDDKRDAHLRSADFFDVERFPTISFRSRAAGRRKDGTLEIIGDLTIRDVTRVVTLEVEGPTPERTSPWGQVVVAASARTAIKRSDFGMTWNAALEAGGVLVGDEVAIEIEAELVKKNG